jgi:hypothetical protein
LLQEVVFNRHSRGKAHAGTPFSRPLESLTGDEARIRNELPLLLVIPAKELVKKSNKVAAGANFPVFPWAVSPRICSVGKAGPMPPPLRALQAVGMSYPNDYWVRAAARWAPASAGVASA